MSIVDLTEELMDGMREYTSPREILAAGVVVEARRSVRSVATSGKWDLGYIRVTTAGATSRSTLKCQ